MTSITLNVKHRAPFGEAVYIFGSTPSCGNWDRSKSLRLEIFGQYVWKNTFEIKNFPFEYKLFVAQWNDPHQVTYEDNQNRVINYISPSNKKEISVLIHQPWVPPVFLNFLPITVKMSRNDAVELLANREWTIQQVKKECFNFLGIIYREEKQNMKLVHIEKVLSEDEKLLGDFGISENSLLIGILLV